MAEQDDDRKFCLEFADFPDGDDLPSLTEKAKAIEEAMTARLSREFRWHSAVAHPEIRGFRVFFEIDPDNGGISETMPETLIGIIKEIAGGDLPDPDPIAA